MTRGRKSDCPIHFGLEVFGDAWSLLIVRDLMFKEKYTYTDLLRSEEGIATNVLADRLARLERDGIIEENPSPGGGYRLTRKGVDLVPVLLEIIRWGARYDPMTAAEPGFVRRLGSDRIALEREIRTSLRPKRPSKRREVRR